jgi:hypothetical protein
MPPAGLNVVKRSGKYVLNAHWKKTQPSCPGSRDLNWAGKGLTFKWLDWYLNCSMKNTHIIGTKKDKIME